MFTGQVIHGDKIGRVLGYRTANLDTPIKKTHLNDGVYAAKAWLHKKEYKAALMIRSDRKKIEVHLIDYMGEDFYDETLKVEAHQKISSLRSFDSQEELKEKIAEDLEAINSIL